MKKLQFKQQDFQDKAVQSAVDLFKGQISRTSAFTIVNKDNFYIETTGYGNTLTISMEQIESNLHKVQERNMLPLTDMKELRFNIEMETGTGKTFVYTNTILELNKQYGFKKFIVLVPSIAIREGVYKSMQTTADYFRQKYDGVTLKPFIYNSSRLHEVRDFAESTNLEVMIINIDAFKKSENLFNQENDRMTKSARDSIKECNPILIIDEPQSIDNTAKSRDAIKNLNPLFELRYSATHREKVNTIYRLTPVDAYQMGIVKQICVANSSLVDDFNKPYIRLVDTDNSKGFTARLELDVKDKKGIVGRKILTVKPNTDLEVITGRDIYSGYVVSGIDCEAGYEAVEFINTERVTVANPLGSIDDALFKKEQIRRTIEIHLDKELRYLDKGIKVLSLFFIDEVKKYRDYDQPDQKGIYAKMFEEIYNELIEKPKYQPLKDFFKNPVDKVHNGYFSQDKKGKVKDTKGDTADDTDTYNTIMKDKEWLLSFECPLRFIFSHSALKEGWDNPNVFQICTLIENKTQFTQRQKIGRGLRLCVKQDGNELVRIEDRNINILHVIAQESFAEFAEKLQTELEEETGIKFGMLDIEMFVGIPITNEETQEETKMTYNDSSDLLDFFRTKNYIDGKNKIKDTLKNDLLNNTVNLPKRLESARERIINQIKQANKKVDVKPFRQQTTVKRKDDMFGDPLFREIWDKIKQKTIYRINMNIDELMDTCIKDISQMNPIRKSQIKKETAIMNVESKGVTYKEQALRFAEFDQQILLPDVLRILEENTKLPRSNIAKIITESKRLQDFLNNPEKYIEAVTNIINHNKASMSIDGLKYTKIDGEEYSYFEMFNLDDTKDIIAYLDSNCIAVDHSLYDHIIYDNSTIERNFADALDHDPDVKFFFKIPDKFKISTPIGPYNPDWAVYVETDSEKKMYFIIETKGSKDVGQLRGNEWSKIQCGKKHFEALESGVEFDFDTKWSDFKKDHC